jgi:hypothetical protein
MPTGTFKTFFKGFVRRTQSQRDEAYLGKSADLVDLEHRQNDLARYRPDLRPLASQLAQARG